MGSENKIYNEKPIFEMHENEKEKYPCSVESQHVAGEIWKTKY